VNTLTISKSFHGMLLNAGFADELPQTKLLRSEHLAGVSSVGVWRTISTILNRPTTVQGADILAFLRLSLDFFANKLKRSHSRDGPSLQQACGVKFARVAIRPEGFGFGMQKMPP
jgi:hypothetical protein